MEVKFKLDKDGDCYVIDLPELMKYRISDQGDSLEYLEAAKGYLKWFVAYCASVLKDKIYQPKQLVPQLFLTGEISNLQLKEFIRCNLFVAKQYIDYLLSKINEQNIQNYTHCLRQLDTDLEWLLIQNEVVVRKKANHVRPTSWSRRNLSATDIYSAARDLFYIEERNSIDELYLRDLKPVVIFQIRQMLEVFGKDILGYYEITDLYDNPVKKFTQVAWEFIGHELKMSDPRIELPFPLEHIKRINSWANNFVHTSYIFSNIIQFYALKYLAIIFKGSGKPIATYDGRHPAKMDIADIKLSRYKSLKTDFELFLNERHHGVKVNWLQEKQVGAYIISL